MSKSSQSRMHLLTARMTGRKRRGTAWERG
jgi:hypothetical protein